VLINLAYPEKLYRYAESVWLRRALELGEFRLRPASDYRREMDLARNDDELKKSVIRPDGTVRVQLLDGTELKDVKNFTYHKEVRTDYYLVCFSSEFIPDLFNDFAPADSCLVIQKPQEFSERMHAAAERQLPERSGIDAPISYGEFSPLGATFTKADKYSYQKEWRFGWRPPVVLEKLEPVNLTIGSIQDIAVIVPRP